ncbi:DUF3106 domain-containing protein [Acidovorax sp. A1169]|jgi:hypothetical protein|uniref:DUF3106 domain-containing protein n=1 Tax=Acidovorax sp. A1169 TaxID=3059524 RepID=UPI002737B818|nr:DUF3106 domain-containing protein [Acidovorax sp. A1169]MDP4075152.1 DUF3106 domain-containing protein [Acidovorax sp. A1169]
MHKGLPDAPPPLPAIVLALALLGALTAFAVTVVVQQVGMAPATLLPSAATRPTPAAATALRPAGGATALPSEGLAEVAAGPGWETLNTRQKLALYPLAERWSLISEVQKRRWLALAVNFPELPEEEQAKLHSRMTEWASLSAQQRSQARLNYASTNRLARDNKLAQWEAYQALTAEERDLLAATAPPNPQGAATALRPVSPRKLVQVPAATQANPLRPNAPKIPPVTDHGPRLAMPIPAAMPAAEASASNPAGPVVVETAPVAVPTAVPAALPPLAPAGSDPAAPAAPPSADNSGLYPNN